jgi:hypothetical protein
MLAMRSTTKPLGTVSGTAPAARAGPRGAPEAAAAIAHAAASAKKRSGTI